MCANVGRDLEGHRGVGAAQLVDDPGNVSRRVVARQKEIGHHNDRGRRRRVAHDAFDAGGNRWLCQLQKGGRDRTSQFLRPATAKFEELSVGLVGPTSMGYYNDDGIRCER